MNITRKTSAIFRYCVHCSFKLDAQSNCNKSKMTSSATKKIIVQSSSFGLVVYTCLMEFLWTLIYATRGACFLEGLRDSVWKLACRAMSNKNNKDTCALLLPSRSPQHNSYQLMCLWLIYWLERETYCYFILFTMSAGPLRQRASCRELSCFTLQQDISMYQNQLLYLWCCVYECMMYNLSAELILIDHASV